LGSLNKKTCSRACSNKNRAGIKYKLSAPRKDKVKSYQALKLRLLEVRGNDCARCSYSKHEILQIHHKDRDRGNNVLENLELICPNCHYEEHYLEKSWLRKVYSL
jgi:5-methylcytosine-specific restriction endonuclease McrA